MYTILQTPSFNQHFRFMKIDTFVRIRKKKTWHLFQSYKFRWHKTEIFGRNFHSKKMVSNLLLTNFVQWLIVMAVSNYTFYLKQEIYLKSEIYKLHCHNILQIELFSIYISHMRYCNYLHCFILLSASL